MHTPRPRLLCSLLWLAAVALLTASPRVCLTPACAQAHEVTSAVVIPVRDASGSTDPMLSEKATDALALALEDSKSYRVIPKEDLARELKADDLTPPLVENEQARVGTNLVADIVFTAALTTLDVNDKTGEVKAGMDLRGYNVHIAAVLTGAGVAVTTKAIPGYNHDPLPVVNEALREVAEQAVAVVVNSQIRHGNVDLVDADGVITTNLGINDGVTIGTRLQVDRGRWDTSQQLEVLEPIGVIELTGAEVRLSQARIISGMIPSMGDRVYVLYSPPSVVRAIQEGHKTTQSLRYLAGLALIVGIVAVATGNQATSPPSGLTAFLEQSAPGAQPLVHVQAHSSLTGNPEGYLLYRGQLADFDADALAEGATPFDGGPLINVQQTKSHTFVYDDHSPNALTELDGLSANVIFQYPDNKGTLQTETLTATYNNAALVVGNSYYYKVRRLADPIEPQLPVSGASVSAAVFTAITFTLSAPAAGGTALGDPSQPAGPVTYTEPATTVSPNLTNAVNPDATTFQWTVAAASGSGQFQVQVYTDASLSTLVATSPLLTFPGGQLTMQYPRPGYAQDAFLTLPGDAALDWVVVSKTPGEASPLCSVPGVRTLPFIVSAPQQFHTVALPPGPAAAAVASGRPSGVRGFWNTRPWRRLGH
jgi:curli biogenesis system outer membrane secretion channel CsgG